MLAPAAAYGADSLATFQEYPRAEARHVHNRPCPGGAVQVEQQGGRRPREARNGGRGLSSEPYLKEIRGKPMGDNMDSGFEFIDLGADDPRVIAMRITGKLQAEVITELVERLEVVSATGQKSLLYIDLVTFEGSELGVVKEKLAHIRTLWTGIERLAYILDWAWMSKMIGLVDAVTPMHLRAFGHDQDEEARAWLLSGE